MLAKPLLPVDRNRIREYGGQEAPHGPRKRSQATPWKDCESAGHRGAPGVPRGSPTRRARSSLRDGIRLFFWLLLRKAAACVGFESGQTEKQANLRGAFKPGFVCGVPLRGPMCISSAQPPGTAQRDRQHLEGQVGLKIKLLK